MMNQIKTIFITGANGFIGGRIAERLFLENRAEVRAGVKDRSRVARIARFPIEIVRCDIMDKKNIRQMIEGSDAVVHCAYGDKRVTEEGTENMLKASLEAGVKKFIYFSTVEIYGNVSSQIDESSPFKYSDNQYGDSKTNTEKICQEYLKKGLPIVILRPTVVYGPFCNIWTIHLAERFLSGRGRILSNINGFCQPIYVDDLVSAVFLTLENENAVGEAFNIGKFKPISWNDFFQRFNKAMGLPSLKKQNLLLSQAKALLISPVRLIAKYTMSNYQDLVMKMCERWFFLKRFARKGENLIRTSVNNNELTLYNRKTIYSIEKARKMLGYSPSFVLDEGLQLTAAWLRLHGYIRENKTH